jgi:hypothetical protein
VRSAHPVAFGAELEFGELRLISDDIDRGEQAGGVDAVERDPGLPGGRGFGDGMCGHG